MKEREAMQKARLRQGERRGWDELEATGASSRVDLLKSRRICGTVSSLTFCMGPHLMLWNRFFNKLRNSSEQVRQKFKAVAQDNSPLIRPTSPPSSIPSQPNSFKWTAKIQKSFAVNFHIYLFCQSSMLCILRNMAYVVETFAGQKWKWERAGEGGHEGAGQAGR